MTRRAFGGSGLHPSLRTGYETQAPFTGYTKSAAETQYNGVKFRSRLEATWAAFFDLAGMAWEYEPIRVPGWIPDFRLFGRFLCEVKPIEMTGFGVVSSDYSWVRKALGDQQVLLFGKAPSDCLCCMATLADGMVSARTVFFDPHAEFKMVSVSGDGGSHPLRGSASMLWREASMRLRDAGRGL